MLGELASHPRQSWPRRGRDLPERRPRASPGGIAFKAFSREGISAYRWAFGDGDTFEGLVVIPVPGGDDGRTLKRFDVALHAYQASRAYPNCLTLSSHCGTYTVCDALAIKNPSCATCRPGDSP